MFTHKAFLPLVVFAAVLVMGATSAAAVRKTLPLYGTVVVIDPGHGGEDPGAHGTFQGKEVFEAPYVMDVARRVAKDVKAKGGIVLFTRYDPSVKGIINSPPSTVLPFTRRDVFASDGRLARAKAAGMKRRLATAYRAKRLYPRHRIVFVSIHFDAEPATLRGVHVIVPESKTRPRIATTLVQGFGEKGRLRQKLTKGIWREYAPVVVNGTARRLYILRSDTNPIRNRVLVELGNFGNRADVWRIRKPEIRQEFSDIIVRALVRANQPQ